MLITACRQRQQVFAKCACQPGYMTSLPRTQFQQPSCFQLVEMHFSWHSGFFVSWWSNLIRRNSTGRSCFIFQSPVSQSPPEAETLKAALRLPPTRPQQRLTDGWRLSADATPRFSRRYQPSMPEAGEGFSFVCL
jgi:hypothetical protein